MIFSLPKQYGILLCSLLIFSLPGSLLAVTDSFLINTIIGNDITAPTVPDNVLATPVAVDQIDVTWDAATDNFAVAGYQVFRDAAQIATTTLTSFSDTGLADDTLFSYTVRAFDGAANFSGFATSSATTTFAVVSTSTPTTTPPTSGGGSSDGPIEAVDTMISDLAIVTTKTTAVVTFTTNVSVRSLFRWGRTSVYETGYAAATTFKRTHRIVITDLEPGTVYESELELLRRLVGEPLVERLSFTTEAGADTVAPANVMDFSAVAGETEIALSWTNPVDPDFAQVRIMSSELFYPISAVDGYLVYEGSASTATDARAVQAGVRYYTIFAFDESGNSSSGAVTSVRVSATGAVVVSDPFAPATTTAVEDETTTIDVADIVFSQRKTGAQVFDDNLTITAGAVTKIEIAYDALPEHLKTIVVYMRHAGDRDKVFSFLLKVNEDKTAFEALFGGLTVTGAYETVVEVFDFETETVSRVQGVVTVVDPLFQTSAVTKTVVAWWRWMLVALLLLGLLWLLWRRRQATPAEDRTV